ncbi:MAG TPA: DUF1186 domain-containing protein [Gammaproteobacteria bacterium]|nr:DUF1186 domain-containing protein [Gammaproteobacteria bacterium]
MDTESILIELDDLLASYQWKAVEAAVAQQEAITPRLLEWLQFIADSPWEWMDEAGPGALYAIALVAHFRESAAHEPLLRIAALPGITLEALIGDGLTELLPAALWRTSGGQDQGLRALIENREAYGFGRSAAADALYFGALWGEWDFTEVRDYLVGLLAEEDFAEEGDPAWGGVFHTVLSMYPQEHADFLREWTRKRPVSPLEDLETDLDWVLRQDRQTFLDEERERSLERLPEDVHGFLAHWAGFQPGYWEELDEDWEALPEPDEGPVDEPLFSGAFGAEPKAKATKPAGQEASKKKAKRKQQKKARKTNRKKRK